MLEKNPSFIVVHAFVVKAKIWASFFFLGGGLWGRRGRSEIMIYIKKLHWLQFHELIFNRKLFKS